MAYVDGFTSVAEADFFSSNTAGIMPAPPTRGTQQSGTALAVTQIRAGYISQSSAHKNVRRKMLLRWIARETYTRGKRVSAPFKPLLMRISVRDYGSESEAGG